MIKIKRGNNYDCFMSSWYIKLILEVLTMSNKKIYLSPSNQDGNMYAFGGTNEMEQCNRIAECAKVALERCGFAVKKAPKGQSMYTSISESNKWGADLHIPIHTNAYNGSAGGTVVFVYSDNAKNMTIAKPIYNHVQSVTPGKTEYGVRENPGLAELSATNAIAVYIEVDFHDNKEIAKWLIENPKLVGEAICAGVCDAFDIKYTPEKQTTVYRVQVGAFTDKRNADNLLSKLKKQGYTDAFITTQGG